MTSNVLMGMLNPTHSHFLSFPSTYGNHGPVIKGSVVKAPGFNPTGTHMSHLWQQDGHLAKVAALRQ